MNEAQAIREFLETEGKPISVKEIEEKTGVDYRHGPFPEMLKNGTLREWWSLNPHGAGKPFEEYGMSENVNAILRGVFQFLTKKPARIEKITVESGRKLLYKKDVHYALTSLMDYGEVMIGFDLEPANDCAICYNKPYCDKQQREYSPPRDTAHCNNFVSTWEEKKNA
jgi:hypothetical protein